MPDRAPHPHHFPKVGAGSLERRRRTAYRHMIKLTSYLKYKKSAIENAEICRSRQPNSRLTPPPWGTFTNIRIYLIPPETTVIGLHFAADIMGLSSFKSCGGLRKRICSETECVSVVQGHPRSLIFGTNRKGIYDFLLVINSNVSTTLHCF